MSSDARTLPLRDAPFAGPPALGRPARIGSREHAVERRKARLAAAALVVLVLCSLLFVVIAADRPSLFSATTHTGFFPDWMAGPLGGLWPGLTRSSTVLKSIFTAALVAMYASYLLALAYAPSRLRARWPIAAILGVHAAFFLAPPMSLTDIFNYVNYGRMEVVHNLNPYTTYPVLEPHGDPSYLLSNWHQLLSPYGPLFTLLTFALVPLGVAASFWVIKLLLAAASLGTIALVWRCAELLDLDPVKAIVLVGLNPIVLVWGLGGDHNDFLMVLCIVLGFYLLLRGGAIGAGEPRAAAAGGAPRTRERGERGGARSVAGQSLSSQSDSAQRDAGAHPAADVVPTVVHSPASWRQRVAGWLWPLSAAQLGAGAAFVAATALKASGGVLIPIVLAGLCRAPRRLVQVLVGMVGAGIVLGIASLIAFGVHIPDLSTQSRLVTSISVPNLIGLGLGGGGETETLHSVLTAALALSIVACSVMAWRRRESITPSGWATVALLVTLGWVLPWYILWLLPLAALSRSRALRTSALALGVYLIIAWAPASSFLWSAIGFRPSKTPLGRLHQRYVKELLN